MKYLLRKCEIFASRTWANFISHCDEGAIFHNVLGHIISHFVARQNISLNNASFSAPLLKENPKPNGLGFSLVMKPDSYDLRVMRPTSVARWGSEGSAAGGGRSDPSEWPGSARDEGAPSPRTFAGDPNRGDTQKRFCGGSSQMQNDKSRVFRPCFNCSLNWNLTSCSCMVIRFFSNTPNNVFRRTLSRFFVIPTINIYNLISSQFQ